MKKLLLSLWLAILFVGIGYIFWHSEWKYSLPTPVPEHYREVPLGSLVDLEGEFEVVGDNRPLFLHFYNPDCPCSRFNVPYFQGLVKDYQDRVRFGVVALTQPGRFTGEEIQDRLDLQIPVAFDSSIAAACGVYSTPQAVLIDGGQRLYYRGNYNKSRYCTDKETNYAQQAIDSLLRNCTQPTFAVAALKSYGCELTNCQKPKP